jgi:hypothetical protein
VVGSGVLNSLQRLRFRNADAFVAFCGWDPRPDDSGRKTGRRRLSKRGSSQLRYLLYSAAMAASRTKAWRPFYKRALAKGLSRVEALVMSSWPGRLPALLGDPRPQDGVRPTAHRSVLDMNHRIYPASRPYLLVGLLKTDFDNRISAEVRRLSQVIRTPDSV